jgi:hypothetical protein
MQARRKLARAGSAFFVLAGQARTLKAKLGPAHGHLAHRRARSASFSPAKLLS